MALEPGSSVVLCTDGLVERRALPLQDDLALLCAAGADQQALSADELCDLLLARFGDTAEDDTALLVLQVHDQDEPRPAAAGPATVPADLRTGG